MAHAQPGSEVLFEELAHMYNWECGNYAAIAGLGVRALRGENGVIAPEQVEDALRPANVHYPETRLVCIENSHNNCAGAAWTVEQMAAVSRVCRERGLKLHVDGARIFNAAVAVGVDVREYTRHVDSVMFCVSKGLSAPVGSLLCGTRGFIDRAHQMRKRLGGAMRQAGIIAAAGIVALERMAERLAEDHENARRLAEGLGRIEGFKVEQPPIPTNILNVDVAGLGWSSQQLIEEWKEFGIRCNPRPPHRARLVTHRHISSADADYVIEVTERLAAGA
jgi:threonine aldolase